jgi:hypothetical protein
MVERLTPHQGGLYEDAEVVHDFLLSVEIVELLWADFILKIGVTLDVSDC